MIKNNFVLYTDYWKQIKRLSMEQRGLLFTALFAFQMEKELPQLDPITDMCFGFITEDIERNNKKYAEVVEKRKAAGAKGGKQKRINLANVANASKCKQVLANANDNDNDNVNDNDSDNDNDTKKLANLANATGMTPEAMADLMEVLGL